MRVQVFVMLCALLVCSACSMQVITGDTMSALTVEQVIPKTMQGDDVGMACASGEAQTGLLAAFGRVTDTPHRGLVMTYMSAGMCSEMRGWEAELSRLLALRDGRAAAAKDAHELEPAAPLEAAQRNDQSYQHLVKAFGEPGGKCPEFDSDTNDALIYLLGLNAGLLSVVHDRGAGGAAGLPLERTRGLARGAACLNNAAFWGVPSALSAAIWTGIPGATPDGIDAWTQLKEATTEADRTGVRLAYAFWIQSLNSAGRADEMCAAVEQYSRSIEATPSAADYRLLDAYAGRVIKHELNKQWIKAVGHRMPAGTVACYAPPVKEAPVELDPDLLDGIDD